MKKYDLTIAHRVCPKLAKTAVGFTDKFEMVSATTKSLLSALDGITAKLFVILDGCDARYEKLYMTTPKSVDIEIIKTNAIGNAATYGKQIELLKTAVGSSSFLYFSEDDYLYDKSAFNTMMAVVDTPGVDFVTPLDHPDRYTQHIFESQKTEIRVLANRHWRKCSTTCLTFMANPTSFLKALPALETYAKGNLDCTMWLAITQENIYRFCALATNLFRFIVGKTDFNHILQLAAWKWSACYILTHRAQSLWSPIPSIALHLCSESIPPNRNISDYDIT